MNCTVDGCEGKPNKGADAFCPACWAKLPGWARRELVARRKAAQRGSRRATEEFMKASAVAKLLIVRGALHA